MKPERKPPKRAGRDWPGFEGERPADMEAEVLHLRSLVRILEARMELATRLAHGPAMPDGRPGTPRELQLRDEVDGLRAALESAHRVADEAKHQVRRLQAEVLAEVARQTKPEGLA